MIQRDLSLTEIFICLDNQQKLPHKILKRGIAIMVRAILSTPSRKVEEELFSTFARTEEEIAFLSQAWQLKELFNTFQNSPKISQLSAENKMLFEKIKAFMLDKRLILYKFIQKTNLGKTLDQALESNKQIRRSLKKTSYAVEKSLKQDATTVLDTPRSSGFQNEAIVKCLECLLQDHALYRAFKSHLQPSGRRASDIIARNPALFFQCVAEHGNQETQNTVHQFFSGKIEPEKDQNFLKIALNTVLDNPAFVKAFQGFRKRLAGLGAVQAIKKDPMGFLELAAQFKDSQPIIKQALRTHLGIIIPSSRGR
ncbi:MAG: hypothetical protein ACOY3I_03280 [Verrucomicrobiota bacterium]